MYRHRGWIDYSRAYPRWSRRRSEVGRSYAKGRGRIGPTYGIPLETNFAATHAMKNRYTASIRRIVGLTLISLLMARLPARAADHWVATWAASPCGPFNNAPRFDHATLREIVHVSIGGEQVRIRLSNVYGAAPLTIAAAHIALRRSGAAIDAATDHALTFSGQPSMAIPAGATALSDPVDLRIPPHADLAVSLYLSGDAPGPTAHWLALQTGYLVRGQDATAAANLPNADKINAWPFLTGVDVAAPPSAAVVVTLGDSITDGANSTADANRRWPNVLADRLLAQRQRALLAVVNAGISGNRVLHDSGERFGGLFGQSALARLDRDVLGQPGVKYVIVLEGINDIGHPGSAAPESDEVTAEEIEAGLRQIVERAHEHGVKAFGATITPFEATTIPNYYTPNREEKRQRVNAWIRTSGVFDAVIDFDRAVRDPAHPSRFLPAFDSGDHLHPNDAGLKAMGESVDLKLLR
jgi:lysophospholipase L1-like esterase